MDEIILIVEDVSTVKKRVVAVVWHAMEVPEIKINDFVKILRPDGVSINSQILGIENLGCELCTSDRNYKALLLKDISKADLARGSILKLLKPKTSSMPTAPTLLSEALRTYLTRRAKLL